MHHTRRSLIKGGTTLAAMGVAMGAMPQSALARPLFALLGSRPEPVPPIEDPRLKQLTDASMAAAKSGGATYADARLAHTYIQRYGPVFPIEEESMTFGVRVLVDGYWGFAASPVWSVDEAIRLSRAAIGNAKANAVGKKRITELAPVSDVPSGHWTMPIKDDAFQIHRAEIEDFLAAIRQFIMSFPGTRPPSIDAEFIKQDKAFASMAGQYCTQRLYNTAGSIPIILEHNRRTMGTRLLCVTRAGAGFEYLRDQPLEQEISKTIEELKADLELPVKPVDVGRYPLVLDAKTVSGIVSQTIGAATELDRALGFEANAGGTSYITDPDEMIGTFQVGTPLVTITADRTKPGSVATVKWDDEGVSPDEFALVKDGMLVDMQTDREGAGWLKSVYVKQQKPVASHGCSFAPLAVYPQMTHCANLTLRSGDDSATFDTLVGDVSNGIAFKGGDAQMDFQQITGLGGGVAFEIKNGKRTAMLVGAGFIFRTPEFWKSITRIGGAASSRPFGVETRKGQPAQMSGHTVTTPPVMLKELTVIDQSRKA